MPLESSEINPPTFKGLFFVTLIALAFYYSGFFVILTPCVFAYILFRHGPKQFALSFVFSFLVVAAVAILVVPKIHSFYQTSPQWEWVFPIPGMNLLGMVSHQSMILLGLGYFAALVGVAVAIHAYTRSKTPFVYLMGVSFGFVLVLYAATVLINEVTIGPFLRNYYSTLLHDFISIQEQAGLPQDQLDFVRQYLPKISSTLYWLTPSFGFLALLSLMILNLALFQRLFRFLIPKSKPLNEWNVPFWGVWAVIGALSLFVGWIYGYLPSFVAPWVGNALMILGFIYYIQGISIISHYVNKRKVSFLIRFLMYGMIIVFFQMSGVALVLAGFFDSWFDFRKIQKKIA